MAYPLEIRMVPIPSDLIASAKEFGCDMADAVKAGNKEGLKDGNVSGQADKPEIQGRSRIAEIGGCLYSGLDPYIALNWDVCAADPGWDYVVDGCTMDIKSSNWYAELLIWPHSHRWSRPRAQYLGLARVKKEWDIVGLVGWIGSKTFWDKLERAPTRPENFGDPRQEKAIAKLKKGTPFMRAQDLTPFKERV